MTFLGKCFTAAVLILSTVFMVLALVANATHINWRDEALARKTEVEQLGRRNSELKDARVKVEQDLNRERAARRTALASLQTQMDEATNRLQTSEAAVQQLEAQLTELTQLDRSRAEELQRLTQENSSLRQQIRSEQEDRDELFARTLELTDKANQLTGLLAVQKERNEQLLAQVTRYTEVTQALGINVDDPVTGTPPDRNGVVLVVDQGRDLVELSIGYDEGLRDGHVLDVSRGGRYLGKVKVRRTEPDRSVATILNDYKMGSIREGDRVDTSIE